MDNNRELTKSTLQIVIGGYVIYLAYGLREGIMTSVGGRKLFLILAAIVMTIVSCAIIIRAVKVIIQNYKKRTSGDSTGVEQTEDKEEKK